MGYGLSVSVYHVQDFGVIGVSVSGNDTSIIQRVLNMTFSCLLPSLVDASAIVLISTRLLLLSALPSALSLWLSPSYDCICDALALLSASIL